MAKRNNNKGSAVARRGMSHAWRTAADGQMCTDAGGRKDIRTDIFAKWHTIVVIFM
jgi:hypothetical protein